MHPASCTFYMPPDRPPTNLLMEAAQIRQGIYKIIVPQYPADRKKGDMERQFFCIYPDMWKTSGFLPPRDSGEGTGKQFFYIYPGPNPEQGIPSASVEKRTFLTIYTRREYTRISVLSSDQSGPVCKIISAICASPHLRDVWSEFRYHSPLCVRLWPKSPTNWDAHLSESIFQTRSEAQTKKEGELST